MSIVLSSSQELKISLDPVRTEDRIPSVAFDLLIEVAMPFQQARITSKECWFTHDALNGFETQLFALKNTERGAATLLDMSDRPVMQILRNGGKIKTTVRAVDTMQMVSTTVEANDYAASLSILHEQFASYKKWW